VCLSLNMGLGVGSFLIVTYICSSSDLGVSIAVRTEGSWVKPLSCLVFNFLDGTGCSSSIHAIENLLEIFVVWFLAAFFVYDVTTLL
jgi:hypothetical protein